MNGKMGNEVMIERRKVIVFQLKDEEYAISVNQVGSIERLQPITRVPHTADFVTGVINLRGVVIPIIDLKARFGIGKTEFKESTRIIIVFFEELEVGLIVDAANDVIDIVENEIELPPAVIGAVDVAYLEGVVKLDGRLFILLNLQKVLTRDEVETLKTVEEG